MLGGLSLGGTTFPLGPPYVPGGDASEPPSELPSEPPSPEPAVEVVGSPPQAMDVEGDVLRRRRGGERKGERGPSVRTRVGVVLCSD